MRFGAALVLVASVGLLAGRIPASGQDQKAPERFTIANVAGKPMTSPDGAYTLYGVPFQNGVNQGPQFWIKNNSTGSRKLLIEIESSLDAFWSSDGKTFVANDHWASDRENAYIYTTDSLKRLDAGKTILAADPAARPFTNAHAYFTIQRYDGADHVLVTFHGHTDAAPVRCFKFDYRVSLARDVEKLSQSVAPPPKGKFCD